MRAMPAQCGPARDDSFSMSEGAGVVVTCGACGSKLRVKAGADGRTGKCPKCGVRIQIQLPAESKSPAGASSAAMVEHAPAMAKRDVVIEKTSAVAKADTRIEFLPAVEKREVAIERPPIVVQRPLAVEAAMESTRREETIEQPPTPGTFLFFSANGKAAEVRVAPKLSAKAQAANGAGLKIGLMALAAMLLGAAALVAIRKWGGMEYWVVKQSIVAWMAGMCSAVAIMSVSAERTSPVRLLAATFAVTSVIAAWLYQWPAAFSPIDLLLMALAIAGSGTAFILAETAPAKRLDVLPATVRVSH